MRALSAFVLIAGCSSGSVSGTLVNGLTGAPIAGQRVLLRAIDEVALTCQVFDGTTGEDGAFAIEGPCLSSSPYRVALPDSSWVVFDGARIEGDGKVGELKAFLAPDGSGLYELTAAGALEHLSTHADIKTETLWDSEETVQFPSAMPLDGDLPRLEAGEYLVFLGAETMEGATVTPLVPSEGRKFGNAEQFTEMTQPWWYLGTTFTSDTEYTRTEATIDASRAIEHARDDKAVRYLPAEALANGRYALQAPGSRRITILDVAH